jgi:hypothetical protein
MRALAGALFLRRIALRSRYCLRRPPLDTLPPQSGNNDYTNGGAMKNPLDSLWGTVISGLVLTLILYNVVRFALQ